MPFLPMEIQQKHSQELTECLIHHHRILVLSQNQTVGPYKAKTETVQSVRSTGHRNTCQESVLEWLVEVMAKLPTQKQYYKEGVPTSRAQYKP